MKRKSPCRRGLPDGQPGYQVGIDGARVCGTWEMALERREREVIYDYI